MPTILRLDGYRFFFYSLENDEPPHIHIEYGDKTAKLWTDPVQLAESHGFRAHEVTKLRAMVIANRMRFVEAWYEHFGNPS